MHTLSAVIKMEGLFCFILKQKIHTVRIYHQFSHKLSLYVQNNDIPKDTIIDKFRLNLRHFRPTLALGVNNMWTSNKRNV